MSYQIVISLWYNEGETPGALAIADAPELGANPHAQKVMEHFGINYEEAQPQSIADCWIFRGCDRYPEIVPRWMSVRDSDGTKISKST